MRRLRLVGLPCRGVASDEGIRTARPRQRGSAARSSESAAQGIQLFHPCFGIQAVAPVARAGICLCSCGERGKCGRRGYRHGTHVRLVRRHARSAVSFAENTRVQRYEDTARSCHGRAYREHSKGKRFHIRCRGRLSGRGRRSLRNGLGCGQPVVWRKSGADQNMRPKWGSNTTSA